jgi:hypothetical protein
MVTQGQQVNKDEHEFTLVARHHAGKAKETHQVVTWVAHSLQNVKLSNVGRLIGMKSIIKSRKSKRLMGLMYVRMVTNQLIF